MFSIGEFSMVSGIPVRTLRFYHEERLLVPAAVDAETGYRSYDSRNLEVASVIVALRSLEFSLDDIREMLAGATDDGDILDHLQRQRTALSDRLKHYQNVVEQIDQVIQQQREAREAQQMVADFKVEERQVAPMLIAGVRMTGRYAEIGQGFRKLYRQLGRHVAGEPLCLFYDGEYRDNDANFMPCVPVRKHVEAEGIELHESPGGRCVTLVHRGPYDELVRSYARVMSYAKQRGHDITLPTREIYMKGPGMIFRGNPKKYLTEIQLPITDHVS